MKSYDIVIIGGGTAGCAAAYIAGKLGLKVLIIEQNSHLGGTMTSGLVVPVMKSGENQINKDFYNDLINAMSNAGGQVTFQGNPGWFNPQILKIILEKMLTKVGVDIIYNSCVADINMKSRQIESLNIIYNSRIYSSACTCTSTSNFSYKGVLDENKNYKILSVYDDTLCTDNTKKYNSIKYKILSVPINSKYYIDATGTSEICKKCNCEFLDEKNITQPVSLRFVMSGVNIDEFGSWLLEYDKDREVSPVENIDGVTHLSTAYTWDTDKHWALAPLFDKAVEENVLKDSDRNYFQVFTIPGMPGSVAFNCPRIMLDNNELSFESASKALEEGHRAILRISKFCNIYLKGFKNAYISDIADMLGVRVSNRIRGRYVLTKDDILSGRKFKNPVVISNYPIDVHSGNKNQSKLEKVSDYQIPLECLASADIDNLFVVGRSLSAEFEAQAAARVQASCFSMGEGLVKYLANNL